MFELIQKRKRLAQVVLVLLVVPFAFFGLESYTSSMGGRDDVATVNGHSIGQREFLDELRQQQERIRAAFGAGVDVESLDTPEARRQLLDSMIARRLVADAALRAGLAVTDEQLRETIAAQQAFHDEKGFSSTRYEERLRGIGMTPAVFEARLRQDMAVAQLTDAINTSAIVPRSVAERLAQMLDERREVQESLVQAAPFLAQAQVGEAQVKDFYESNAAEFRVPARVRAEYLVVSAETLGGRDKPGDAEVRAAYEARAAQYRVPEQRRASHILVKTQDEAARIAAEARKAPARFAELARKHSQDPGSAEKGGDLGLFGRGMMVPAFEEAAFKLAPGEVSEPVQSDFGWHVIRVTGVQPASVRPYADVRDEIAQELARQQGARRLAEAAEPFSNLVYEQADSLAPAAERFKLGVQKSEWLSRAPSPEAGVLGHPKLLAALFSDDAIKAKRNTEAVEVAPGTLVAARVLEYQPETQRKLDEVRAGIESRLRAEGAARLAQKAGEAKLAELRGAGNLAIAWGPAKAVSRRSPQGVPAGALRQIMSADLAKLPAYAGAARGAEGYVLYRVGKLLDPEPRPETQRVAERARAAQFAGARQLEAYIDSLRARAEIEIHAAQLEKRP
jgi:peptidyl-prolyl cis-trans isomerase D